jgi:integrase/recombinase XerC/integrase/recombinase XerD
VYAAAVASGLRADKPAVGVRAARDRGAPEDSGYLSEVVLALLFRAVPHDDELKHLRDRALLGLLGLQALTQWKSLVPTSTTCSATATAGRCCSR